MRRGSECVVSYLLNKRGALFSQVAKLHLRYARPLPEEMKPIPEPDGGYLPVRMIADAAERAALRAKAEKMPQVKLGPVDLQWAHVVADGWASPLAGFMREEQYVQWLHFGSMRLADGEVVSMPIPIVLAISDSDNKKVTASGPGLAHHNVALMGPTGDLFGILWSAENYPHNKKERVIRTWGRRALRLPYVKELITSAGNWLLGGELQVLEPIKYNDGLDHYRLSPRQLRKEFQSRGADAVFALQLGGPLHNGHAVYVDYVRDHLLKMGYEKPILLLHPLGGFTNEYGLPLAVRMEQYSKALDEGILDPDSTVLAIFPSPMNFLGPKEVLWHAKARINAGANFYITGQLFDFCRSEGVYHKEHGDTLFHLAPGLDKIHMFPYFASGYSKVAKKMQLFGSCPRDLQFFSEAKVRRYAIKERKPPHGFMGPGAWDVLAKFYKSLQSDKLEPSH